ncbi:MAG: hypothetical protein IPJ30_14790 [Acidobacteria bacterium]|nr:hypothetical protein [Acidobacteriota bacterium]
MDRAERGHKPKGFARKAPGRANKRQAANRKKRKTTGSEDDLEWTKALSSTPPDRGAPEVCPGGELCRPVWSNPKKAMEMPLMWKLRKTKNVFPQFPQSWKSQKAAFPHSQPQAAGYKSLKTKDKDRSILGTATSDTAPEIRIMTTNLETESNFLSPISLADRKVHFRT